MAFKALGEPRRVEILRLLRTGPRAVGEIAAEVDVSQQAASQHLAVLDKAGLVEARREGTRRLYAIRPEGFCASCHLRGGLLGAEAHGAQAGYREEAMTETYRISIDIAATPEQVFDYFVRPELLVRWMGDVARLEAVEGGLFSVDINGIMIRGHFVLVDWPHLIEIAWGEAGNEVMPPGQLGCG